MSEKPTGLHCPGCGKRAFRTLDSRPTHGGQRRRKVCVSCQFRVTTIESIIRSGQPQPVRRKTGEGLPEGCKADRPSEPMRGLVRSEADGDSVRTDL